MIATPKARRGCQIGDVNNLRRDVTVLLCRILGEKKKKRKENIELRKVGLPRTAAARLLRVGSYYQSIITKRRLLWPVLTRVAPLDFIVPSTTIFPSSMPSLCDIDQLQGQPRQSST
jgi:hypothetical protein